MTRGPTSLAAALFAALVVTLGGTARADPIRASLTVTRDDGSRDCPDSAALGERVEMVTGKSLFGADASEPSDTWVQVEFVRSISGFRALISARGSRQGTRALDDVGPECASLADAVAITLAILLDPAMAPKDAAAPVAAPAVAPAPTAVLVPPVDVGTPARAPAATKTSEPVVFGWEASAGVSLAVLDAIAPLVEAGAIARVGDVFVLGAGGGFVPDRVEFGSGNVELSLVFGSVRACANLLPRQHAALEVCLESMLGGLRGAGNGYDEIHTEWVLWSAVAALVRVYGPITQSVLWTIRARALAPLVQHGFSVTDAGETAQVFELPVIGGTLAFGIEAEL